VKSPFGVATIRQRLTAWYAGALTVMLLVYAATTYVAVRHEFIEQLDGQLHDDFEDVETRLTRAADGRVTWVGQRHHDDAGEETRIVEVWSAAGEQILRAGATAPLPPVAFATVSPAYSYANIVADGKRWRALTAPVTIGGYAEVLRVAVSAEPLHGQLMEILIVLALGLPLVVILSGVGGYGLARRALAPIERLASEAKRITAERLHERLNVANPSDEIGRLTQVINDTLARLETSFDQLRRFTADASHELRTPLAVVRGIGEAAVAGRRSPAEYGEAIGSMLEEVDRMTNLVDTLLRLSRGDAGTIRLSRERIDLGHLAKEAVGSLAILAEERGQTVTLDADESAVVNADRLVLREAVTNVLDNAIKYSPPGSRVSVQIRSAGPEAVLTVIDEGPGIAAEHRERIFDRFFRIDEARSRDRGGAGLGLAIAKSAVEIHGGRIGVEQPAEGGSALRIVLPLATPARVADGRTPARMKGGGP
jgi:heavy metal sensor kinase